MNILLYNPPIFQYSSWHGAQLPILSLPMIAAMLNAAGHNARVIDMEALGMRIDQISYNADVIGLTSMTTNRKAVQEIIRLLRERGYEGMVMVGGVYATLYPEEVLGWGADLVVTGECEGNIVELLNSRGIHAGKSLPIEQIPIPDWAHYEPNTISYHGNMKILADKPGITMWSRGCPYRCIFCENIIFQGRPTRYRPPQNIEQEMRQLKERGHRDIFIYDDELLGTKIPDGWMADIADRVGGLGLNMLTQGRCSKKFVTPDVMKEAKRAGINTVFWGVESLSQRVLDAIKKHITDEDVWRTLEAAKIAGIRNGLYVQVGQYQEDEKDLRITEQALKSLYRNGLVDYMNVFVTNVMPGTELHQLAIEEGWYQPLPDGWREMKKAIFDTPWLSKEKITTWRGRYRAACPTPAL